MPTTEDAYANIQRQDTLLNATLNDFNTAFIAYQNAPTNENTNQLKQIINKLNTQISSYNTIIANFIQTANRDSISNTNIHASILSRQKANVDLRNELDMKLKEIYGDEGTVQGNLKYKYDNTAYASIMWSVLATSLIYYVFVKL